MKKKLLSLTLDKVNAGHAYKVTHYWLRDGYLLRIANAKGNHFRKPVVIISDGSTAMDDDLRDINYMAMERDTLEDALIGRSKQGPGSSRDEDINPKQGSNNDWFD